MQEVQKGCDLLSDPVEYESLAHYGTNSVINLLEKHRTAQYSESFTAFDDAP